MVQRLREKHGLTREAAAESGAYARRPSSSALFAEAPGHVAVRRSGIVCCLEAIFSTAAGLYGKRGSGGFRVPPTEGASHPTPLAVLGGGRSLARGTRCGAAARPCRSSMPVRQRRLVAALVLASREPSRCHWWIESDAARGRPAREGRAARPLGTSRGGRDRGGRVLRSAGLRAIGLAPHNLDVVFNIRRQTSDGCCGAERARGSPDPARHPGPDHDPAPRQPPRMAGSVRAAGMLQPTGRSRVRAEPIRPMIGSPPL